MTLLSYDRHCSEIVAQPELLRSCIEGADLRLAGQGRCAAGGRTARRRTRRAGVDPGPRGSANFYARRFAHETVIHRADATLALDAKFTLDEEVDVTGDAIVWRRAHEKTAVAVRCPQIDTLLILYKRSPARVDGVDIIGDAQLLDFWLERISFG